MIVIGKYAADKAEEWDRFVNRSRCPMFMFNRGFMDYHADRFEDASLMFYRDDELIAVLLATRHGDEIRSHGGLTYGGMIVGERMKQGSMLECFESMRSFYRDGGVRSILYKQIPHIYKTQSSDEDLYALFRCASISFARFRSSRCSSTGASPDAGKELRGRQQHPRNPDLRARHEGLRDGGIREPAVRANEPHAPLDDVRSPTRTALRRL